MECLSEKAMSAPFNRLSCSSPRSLSLEKKRERSKLLSSRRFHITKHSTYDALRRIEATPNKTIEPNKIEKNRCGYSVVNTHTHNTYKRRRNNIILRKVHLCKGIWPMTFLKCVYVCLCVRECFFSLHTKLQYEKNAFIQSHSLFFFLLVCVSHFKFANGTSDKNQACNQTPGHNSIAIAL